MKIVVIPGYIDLFGLPEKSYEDYVRMVPSDVIVSILIVINAELNAPGPNLQNQNRLKNFVGRNFSVHQFDKLNQAFLNYSNRTQGKYEGDIFGRHYLIGMILKELNNYRKISF